MRRPAFDVTENVSRSLVPLLGLVLLVIFAVLYIGDSRIYYRVLNSIGVPAWRYPFIDWEYIGAGIKCWKEGINVYITNPCDVLNRPHDYSPIWLRAAFIPTDRSWTMQSGLVFVFAFLISLLWLVRPTNWRELTLFSLTCMSPMVIYTLERGNIDMIMFIMLVVAGVLSTGPMASRILCYALMLLAALLKFYPVVALSAVLRERPYSFVPIAGAAGVIIVGFLYLFGEELVATWQNIPPEITGYGATKLPFDLVLHAVRVFPGLQHFGWFTTFPYVIMTVLLMVTAVQVICLSRNDNLVFAFVKMPERDAGFLIIGAALIAGCFFAGRNDNYRGVHLLFVVAGFVAMRRVTDIPATGALLTQSVMIVSFLMWAPFFSHFLHPEQPGPVYGFYWLFREVLWWRLVALLLSVLVIFGAQSELFAALQRWRLLRVRSTE